MCFKDPLVLEFLKIPASAKFTDKHDAVVRYTLGEAQQKKIFASRYQLHLPTEAELKAELLRELRTVGSPAAARPASPNDKTKP